MERKTPPKAHERRALVPAGGALIGTLFMVFAIALGTTGRPASADIYGDCGPSWATSGQPLIFSCRKNYDWVPGTKTLRLEVLDSGFATSGAYYNHVHTWVVPAWNAAIGPQSLKFYSRNNDTNILLYGKTDAQMDANYCALPGCAGQTFLCDINDNCAGTSKDVWYSKHYFAIVDIVDPQPDIARMNGSNWTIANRRWAIAHEIGHGLGLDHNDSSISLMYPTKRTFWEPTDGFEGGTASPCSSSSSEANWGVRCVYHYTQFTAGGDDAP